MFGGGEGGVFHQMDDAMHHVGFELIVGVALEWSGDLQ